jgi:hypothetical protein
LQPTPGPHPDLSETTQRVEEKGFDGALRSLVSRQRSAAANKISALLRHHQYAGVNVRGDEIGHRRSIADAQSVNAVHFEIRIQHAVLPDRAGASGMMCGDDELLQPGVDVGVGLHRVLGGA